MAKKTATKKESLPEGYEEYKKVIESNNNSQKVEKISDDVIIRPALKPITRKNMSEEFSRRNVEKKIVQIEKEANKTVSTKKTKDKMSVLDFDSKQMSSLQKSLIGIGTLMILLTPFILFFAFLYQIKEWLSQYWESALNITVIIGAIVGIGNILFDVFSRMGIMRGVYTWISNNITKEKIIEEKQ